MRPKTAGDECDERGRHALADLFRTLGDPGRLHVVMALAECGELYVGQLIDLTGLSQPAVSFHLSILRAAGLAEFRRDGKFTFYRLASGFDTGLLARCPDQLRLGPVTVRVSQK